MSSLVETVDEIFSETGALSKLPRFEYRPQQHRMAVAVADALQARKHLIIEAPTGVGKSLAYLIPTILYARSEKRKALISTHTKNLQEQLYRKDIAIVRDVLGNKDVHAMVLKGRRNYLCTSRLKRALASSGSLFDGEEQEELHRINAWSHTSEDGDVENLGFTPRTRVWEMVCSEKGVCSSSICGSTCFFQKTKERVRAANVVIMNHALFFTLLALQESEEGFIYKDDFVVFDEAHTLESVAGTGIGKNISRYQVLAAIHRLYQPRTKKGLLARQKKGVLQLCADAEDAAIHFFEVIRDAALAQTQFDGRQNNGMREVRVRQPFFVENTLSGPLHRLEKEVERIQQEARNEALQAELAVAGRSLWEARLLIGEFLEQSSPDLTYWIELSTGRNGNITLCCSPTNVAEVIGPRIFRDQTPVIMTSATLAVNNTLDYFQRRIGAVGVEGIILDSPFDMQRQMRVYVGRDIPEPESPEYIQELPRWIMLGVDRSRGKALVLFTSAALMHAMAERLREEFAARGLKLLVQGVDRQRHDLLEEFKTDVHSVLFGLESFWQGIDVPGEALQHVIITRLPFAVPNHPLVEAKLEEIAKRGGNSFREYTLPEAVLKFRQGVGRLIRTRSDSGIVSILDSRVLRRSYGRVFLASLPTCPVALLTADGEEVPVSREEWAMPGEGW
ncbi:MAG TPA: helicase C-terminal domain-containing protein [Bacteroidota bacterium]|nr:helicase C-terminal domain-containing protein [Bacteroidota bacterium]